MRPAPGALWQDRKQVDHHFHKLVGGIVADRTRERAFDRLAQLAREMMNDAHDHRVT